MESKGKTAGLNERKLSQALTQMGEHFRAGVVGQDCSTEEPPWEGHSDPFSFFLASQYECAPVKSFFCRIW